jgi:UPF0755 protein
MVMELTNLFRQTKAYIGLLVGAMVIVLSVLIWGSAPMSRSDEPIRVVVPQGASGKTIAGLLHEKDVIRSPFVFRLTCSLSGSSGRLKPGAYEFTQSMSLPDVIKRLVRGETLQSWVTVPEGFTARQIADTLEAKQLANPQEFLDLALRPGYGFFNRTFAHGSSLEGYLFPDTYLIDRVSGTREIVEKMLDAFEKKALEPRRARIEEVIAARFHLGPASLPEGLHRILTLASLVEREAKVDRDRPLIAAVLWNRLKKNMRLEVDATISYRPGESTTNKERTYLRDLRTDSDYNTYRRSGLPPGPICNPGVAAIDAVLDPSQADYLYYVAKPDGSHVFSRTFEEHVKAKNDIASGKL